MNQISNVEYIVFLNELSDTDLDTWLIKLAETGRPIQIAVEGQFNHPVYGKIDWSIERLQRYKENFDNNVRGQQIPINVEHIQDNPEGAAGWWKACEIKPVKWIDGTERMGLFVTVDWTDYGRRLVSERRFKYISPEFFNSWTHPETGEKNKDVMIACALTIQPFIKGMQEVILSELTATKETVSLIEETEEAVKMADTAEAEEEKPESIEDLLKQHDAVITKISECIKGKKGVTAARHQIKMSKKLLDELYTAHFKPENNESEGNKSMSEENKVEMAELEAMKAKMTELEQQQQILSEKAKLAEAQAQRLAELEAENRKMVVDSKVSYLSEMNIIKPGEAEVVRQAFAKFAEMSDNIVKLTEGQQKADILSEVVELMQKACYKLSLNTEAKGTGTVETEPQNNDTEQKMSDKEKIQQYMEHNKVDYMTATIKLREKGELGELKIMKTKSSSEQ